MSADIAGPAVASAPASGPLQAQDVRLAYPRSQTEVLHGVSVSIEPEAMTAIIGPNACGKSTLLKTFGRILQAHEGHTTLGGRPVREYGAKEFARLVGMLPQSATAPAGITVADLVSRGRYPHQGLMRQWSGRDEAAVAEAMERTGTREIADRPVASLSGGQRQRVWIAMVLAQQTGILLLDEPTTFLDLTHQIDVLELCQELVDGYGTTIVAVLHDLNQAGRYADRIVAMRDGQLVASGTPAEVITTETVKAVFDLDCRIIPDPEAGTPLVVPKAGAHSGPVGRTAAP